MNSKYKFLTMINSLCIGVSLYGATDNYFVGLSVFSGGILIGVWIDAIILGMK